MVEIKSIIAQNPSGLLELKPSLTIPEYRDNYGFGLKNVCTIFESKRIHVSGEDWFAHGKDLLENLFRVQEESDGDLLVVFIVETIKSGHVYCHLILSDEAYNQILSDKTQHVLQVHQMYSQYLGTNYIDMNMMAA